MKKAGLRIQAQRSPGDRLLHVGPAQDKYAAQVLSEFQRESADERKALSVHALYTAPDPTTATM